MYETAAGDAGCVLGFSCLARKAQASRFGTKTQLAGRTPAPNAACRRKIDGCTTKHISAQPFAPRRGTRRADVCGFADRLRIHAGLRHANAASAHRGGVKKTRMKNFDLVILLGHSKTNFDPQDGGAV